MTPPVPPPATHPLHASTAPRSRRPRAGGRRLLDVLRRDLGLTGTKEGCGEGECGACAVLVDGELVNSCLVPVGQVDGHEIAHRRGPRGRRPLSPLQQAFHEVGGAQCGLCTPGMLLAAHALLVSGRPAGDRGHPRGDRRQPLPLHGLHEDHRGDRGGGERRGGRRRPAGRWPPAGVAVRSCRPDRRERAAGARAPDLAAGRAGAPGRPTPSSSPWPAAPTSWWRSRTAGRPAADAGPRRARRAARHRDPPRRAGARRPRHLGGAPPLGRSCTRALPVLAEVAAVGRGGRDPEPGHRRRQLRDGIARRVTSSRSCS